MMNLKTSRVQSIDMLRGLVMVIMALDHVRFFLHHNAMLYDATNLDEVSPAVFLTRFVTHVCAPFFVFLAGSAAFLYGQSRTKVHLSRFLLTRGIWLIVIKFSLINFIWYFNPAFNSIYFGVIWAIGASMLVLALLVKLPLQAIIIFGLLLVFGHNLFDGVQADGMGAAAIVWYILHQQTFIQAAYFELIFQYPLIPWVGVMALGYAFGSMYGSGFDAAKRKAFLLQLGLVCIGLFVLLRGLNIYGDPEPWTIEQNQFLTLLSFLNVEKYPPSLLFLLMTMGPAFLLLYLFEKVKVPFANHLVVFGRVAFFYYIVHLLLIHLLALLFLLLSGGDWRIMIITSENFELNLHYGYPLWVVYMVWAGVVLLLYPVCLTYMRYKAANRDKWWLAYL